MSVTLDQAIDHLNLTDSVDYAELMLYVEAANEWIGARVTDTTASPVVLAGLFLIDHWWDSQRGPAATPLAVAGEYVTINGRGYAIPNRVLELLGPFLTQTAPTGCFPDARAWPDPVEWC